MEVRLTGKKSIYEEITDTYERYIRLGVLREGERLPSVRVLAVKLGINPNTVERAYTELEARGLIRTIPKKGAFVHLLADAEERAREEARRQLQAMKDAGLSAADVHALVGEVFGEEPENGTRGGTSGPEGGTI